MNTTLSKTIDKLPLTRVDKTNLKAGLEDLVNGGGQEQKEEEFPSVPVTIYVDGVNGDNNNKGFTKDKPIKNITNNCLTYPHIKFILLSDTNIIVSQTSQTEFIEIESVDITSRVKLIESFIGNQLRCTIKNCIINDLTIRDVKDITLDHVRVGTKSLSITTSDNSNYTNVKIINNFATAIRISDRINFQNCIVSIETFNMESIHTIMFNHSKAYIKRLNVTLRGTLGSGPTVITTSNNSVITIEDVHLDVDTTKTYNSPFVYLQGPACSASINLNNFLKEGFITLVPSFVVGESFLKLTTDGDIPIKPYIETIPTVNISGGACELDGIVYTENIFNK